jgi:predicted XRE-type DNA-binding protein
MQTPWGEAVDVDDRPIADEWTVERVRQVRALLVYHLRQQRAPLAVIAEGLGISEPRVCQIAQQAERVAHRVTFPVY